MARRLGHGTDRVRSIGIKVADASKMNVAMIEVERAVRRMHKIRPSGDNDFMIRNQADLLATFQQTPDLHALSRYRGLSLPSAASDHRHHAGVGRRRTREIGVRKALGATRFNILFQFLVEALVLCLAGGALGVLFGSGGAILLSKLAHWNTSI
jgi:putative ABC transport system permease protein